MIFPYPQHVFVCVFYRTLWWLRYRALIRTLRPWQLRNTLIPVWVTVRETSASPVISPPKHKGCALKSLLFLWGSQTIVTQYIALCLPVWTCCELPPGCWYAVAKMIWVVVYWFLFQCRSMGFFLSNKCIVCVCSPRFKAKLWLCESHPLSLAEQVAPIIDLMAISNALFAKLRDFITLRLPPGFPVKIGERERERQKWLLDDWILR